MKKTPSPYIVRAIYRKTDSLPQVKEFASMKEIFELLGSVPLCLTEISDDIYAISRAYARANGEPMNICTTNQVGNTLYVRSVCGDVVVCRYDPKNKIFSSLTGDHLAGLMLTPADIS